MRTSRGHSRSPKNMSEIFAALRKVTKAYPRSLAARDVTIELLSGEVHALVGENGAGKTTLVKVLAGTIQPDAGFVEVNGERRKFPTPRDALLSGIGIVHQAGSLIETLTVRENLRLGKILSRRVLAGLKSPELASILPEEISLDSLVGDLNPRQRQLLEIHRLLLQRAGLLVLDESTSNLAPQESDLLFGYLNKLAQAGYAVVVVSHKIPELLRNCHRFTVLKKGRVVASLTRNETTLNSLVRLLSETELSPNTGPVKPNAVTSAEDVGTETPLLRFRRVCTNRDLEAPIYDLDLDVRRREVLGVVGRPGSGVSTVLQLMRKESIPLASGDIRWSHDPGYGTDPSARIGFAPADRTRRGVIGELTAGENLMLRRRNLIGRIWSREQKRERQAFLESLIREFDIRPSDPQRKVSTLSGGNAQKVLLAREMEYSGPLLIVESPTAGLDIASASFVRRVLRKKASEGGSVVLASEDLDELTELADRVLVFCRGRCVAQLHRGEFTPETLGLSMSESTIEGLAAARLGAGER